MIKQLLVICCCLPFSIFCSDIPTKTMEAKRTTVKVVIDGQLAEDEWRDAAIAKDFTEFRPVIGGKETEGNHTITYLMYDNNGIYFGGYCYEKDLNHISKELVGRDGFGANDYIGIAFDTYNDKINGFEYFVTPLGEQWDAKMTPDNEDFSWNAVWNSAVKINNDNWSFEIFIPYAAIRFGKKEVQDWGMNITRRRRKTEQQYTWNAIDPNVNGYLTQSGIWGGIQNIKPPIRLQLYPYFSFYQNHFPANQAGQKNWTSQVTGGLDLKWGINQAFTLDATLVPDFGQVQSDNQVLNLSPFEVQFNENRTFFTEGTELFSKGNLFYSRRIGGQPLNLGRAYENLGVNETVLNNPSVAKLVNASKISGRTNRGLGIGVLNAFTRPQKATIINNETGETRTVETDPTTNYNITVLDQTLKNNSNISLINTSVLRANGNYNANVTAGIFNFNDRKNTYNISGNAAISSLNYKQEGQDKNRGYKHSLGLGKSSGNLQFQLGQDLVDTKFNSNDLGYFTNNNFLDHFGYVGYRVTKPKGFYNRLNFNANAFMSRLFSPIGDIETMHQSANVNLNANAQTKKLIWFGLFSNYRASSNDFYEPRITGKYFKRGESLGFGGWLETNSANKYSFSAEFNRRVFFDFYDLESMSFYLSQTFRFNSKFSVRYDYNYNPTIKGIGFTSILDSENILFATRKVNTVENTLTLKYNFTNKMGINLRTRHYRSGVENKDFFLLQKDGSLLPHEVSQNYDRNINFFNVDMVYTWQFAPGSFMNLVWKNATVHSSDFAGDSYVENLRNTLQDDQNNNLSLKVIYFLDYLQLKKG